jgi:hypothetical protein
MAGERPSLTPHRDATEKVIAQCDPQENWVEQMAHDVACAMARTCADALDRGHRREDVLQHLPKVLRSAAINGLSTCNARDPLIWAPSFLILAASPEATPDEVVKRSARIAPHSSGGRA